MYVQLRFCASVALSVASLAVACGDDDGADSAPDAGGSMAGQAASATDAGPPRRPPIAVDAGQPDGVRCQGRDFPGGYAQCAVGEDCCWNGFDSDVASECRPGGTGCADCNGATCGPSRCDGPEDCPGKLCCRRASNAPPCGEAKCPQIQYTVQCEDSCEPPGRVVCRRSEHCLNSDDQCNPRPPGPPLFPQCLPP